jgi:cytochrome c biogenesis protein CcmG, thiol:disulfide interchange protein DsbE
MAAILSVTAGLKRRDFLILAGLTAGLGMGLLGPTRRAEAALKIGDAPPRTTLWDRQGRKIVFPGDYKGQVGLIHFWASWCPYCIKEIRAIEALYQTYKNKGFCPYSINVGETPVAVEAYIAHIRISYPIPLDGNSAVARLYGVTGIPTTFIVDRAGLIRHKILGEINKEGLNRLISVLMI